jgi:hypothetical protein
MAKRRADDVGILAVRDELHISLMQRSRALSDEPQIGVLNPSPVSQFRNMKCSAQRLSLRTPSRSTRIARVRENRCLFTEVQTRDPSSRLPCSGFIGRGPCAELRRVVERAVPTAERRRRRETEFVRSNHRPQLTKKRAGLSAGAPQAVAP